MHSKYRISARWILFAGIIITQVSCDQVTQVAAKIITGISPEAPYQLPAEASNYARFEQKLELPSLLEVEQARQLLRSHEFSSLDTLLSELDEAASSDARQELRLKYIFDKLSADESTYRAWVKRNPLNSYAHIGLAMHYDAKAWEARSGAFYQNLSDEQKEGFARYKEQTRSAIAKARKLAPDSLLANRIHLNILLAFGHKKEHFKALKAALEKFPHS